MTAQAPATDVTVDGTTVRTLGTNFRSRWGWENTAAVRAQPLAVAYADGGLMADGGLDAKLLGFDMLVWSRDRATGTTTTNPYRHLDENVAWLKGLFGTGGELDVRFTRQDGSIHQAYNARVVDAMQFQPTEPSDQILRARIPLWVPEGSLRDITGGVAGESDATNTNLTGSGSFNITTDGNVRTSPRITIDADTLTSDLSLTFPDGASLTLTSDIPATQTVVIDTGYTQGPGRSITLEGAYADAMLSSVGRRSYWAYLEPGSVNTISYSSTAGQFDVTVDWYDRWR